MANDSGVHPGWYADPLRRFDLRYYNGTSWTADVSNDGDRFIDPLGLEVTRVPVTGGSSTSPDVPNSLATAAMVLGIIAVAIAWMPFIVVLGVIAAMLALVFGIVGVRRSSASGVGRSRAVAGVVTGACGLVVAVFGIFSTFVVLDVYNAYTEPGPHEATITSCTLVGSRATATGNVTNLGTEPADYSVLIGFVREGTDNPHRSARAVLDDVEPGERSDFQVERQVDLDEVDCIVIEVTGPLPFGLTLE